MAVDGDFWHPLVKSAFDQLQLELSLEVNEAMSQTRQKLLENFDDEVREKLKIRDEDTKVYLDRFEHLLMRLPRDYAGIPRVAPRSGPAARRSRAAYAQRRWRAEHRHCMASSEGSAARSPTAFFRPSAAAKVLLAAEMKSEAPAPM